MPPEEIWGNAFLRRITIIMVLLLNNGMATRWDEDVSSD